MTTDITELARQLKAAAEKATPGEWVYFPKNTSIEYDVGSDESQGSILYVDSGDFTQAQTDRNGEFIALANPANILALVEALEKAQETIAFQQGEIKALLSSLESRTVTVKLPQRLQPGADGWDDWYVHSDDEGEYLKFDDVLAMLTSAGIKVEAE
ncbi:ead/Ea22-like family protein [Klebsiella pneumoniae]|uniref:ead/Ea22-like family protein n=1 Tax=Klebsiella pneumoniae TaxID=573 RepID=UPI001B314C87|nr:ead/Ea22-like family protein [Klebsiella pneumoniae]MBP3101292.1 ead/Ea22-like family protein [Klebsiella pneumoniae]